MLLRNPLKLVKVYLDAVFRPNLRYLDFLQEAWRIGEGDEETGMVFKGVVFNEMKVNITSLTNYVIFFIYRVLWLIVNKYFSDV